MVQIILQQAFAQTTTTTQAPVNGTVTAIANLASTFPKIVGIISGIVANPTMAAGGILVVALVGGIVWFYFRKKIRAWFAQIASVATDKQRQDVIGQQEIQNQQANDIDNKNQQDLNNMK